MVVRARAHTLLSRHDDQSRGSFSMCIAQATGLLCAIFWLQVPNINPIFFHSYTRQYWNFLRGCVRVCVCVCVCVCFYCLEKLTLENLKYQEISCLSLKIFFLQNVILVLREIVGILNLITVSLKKQCFFNFCSIMQF